MCLFSILALISSKCVHPSGVHCEFWMWRGCSITTYCHLFSCPHFRARGAGIQRLVGLSMCERVGSHPGGMKSTYSCLLEMVPRPLTCWWETLFYDSSWADHRSRHPAKETRKGNRTIAPSAATVPYDCWKGEEALCACVSVADIYSFHSKESSVVDFPIVVIAEFQHN